MKGPSGIGQVHDLGGSCWPLMQQSFSLVWALQPIENNQPKILPCSEKVLQLSAQIVWAGGFSLK